MACSLAGSRNRSTRKFLLYYLKQTKMSFFFLLTKSENRRVEIGRWGGGRERAWEVNIVQILHTHVCKWKNGTL
jgi:hypothetical protein